MLGNIDLGFFTTVIAVVVNMIMAFFVYKNNPKSATNIIFLFLSTVTSVWLLAMYGAIQDALTDYALFLTRLTVFFAIPQSVSFFLLAHTLPSVKLILHRHIFWAIVIVSTAVMFVTLSPYVFTSVERVDGELVQTPGPAMPLFGLFASSFSIAAVYTLIRKIRKSQGHTKQQLQLVLWGIIAMLGLIIATILLPVMLWKNDMFVPFAPLYSFLFLGATAYAIVKHGLFDVRFIVSRAVSYTLLAFLATGVYTILLFGAATILFNIPMEDINAPFFLSGMGIAVLLAFTFQSFQRFIS